MPEDERKVFLKRMRNPRAEILQKKAIYKKAVERCKRVKLCPRCGDFNGDYLLGSDSFFSSLSLLLHLMLTGHCYLLLMWVVLQRSDVEDGWYDRNGEEVGPSHQNLS